MEGNVCTRLKQAEGNAQKELFLKRNLASSINVHKLGEAEPWLVEPRVQLRDHRVLSVRAGKGGWIVHRQAAWAAASSDPAGITPGQRQ